MINQGRDTGFNKSKIINRRMFIFSAVKTIIFFGIVGRLFSLQINENKKYLTLSDKNRLRETRLPPVRGEFKDFFGNTIAGNLKVYQLHVIPEQVEDFNQLIIRLRDILNITPEKLSSIIKKKIHKNHGRLLLFQKIYLGMSFQKLIFICMSCLVLNLS